MALFSCLVFRRRVREGRRVEVIEEEGDEGVRRFSREEIERLKFSSSKSSKPRVIAHGGFSTVFLGKFSDSRLAAIKVVERSGSERMRRIYKQELEILSKIQHENIVKILGFSDDDDDQDQEGALVLEYVSNGTLQEKLHGSKSNPLEWKSRTRIAFQLAKSLDYLHDHCELHIVHGDLKASNVLLDIDMNCKLCDFGSAKMGFSSSISSPSTNRMIQMVGSPGYADPHYLRTGIASKKNDIYSFGIILLELITGLEALDNGVRLVSKVGPMLKDVSKVVEMVDRRLCGDFELDEAMAMASLAGLCLSDPPSLRPSASDIVATMRNSVASATVAFESSSVGKKS